MLVGVPNALSAAQVAAIRARLDGAPEPIVLPGYIRSRVLAGALVRYGIQFDLERVPEAEIAALERAVDSA